MSLGRSRWWHLLGMSLFSMVLAVAVNVAWSGSASAACSGRPDLAFGRPEWCGYFRNQDERTGERVMSTGLPGHVTNVTAFINHINFWRQSGNVQNSTGAKFIILTMMNQPGGTPMSRADDLYDEWAARVRAYGSVPGKINFFYDHPFRCNILNSYYQESARDDAFNTEPASLGRCGPTATRSSMIFRDLTTNAIIYAIKRDCANPIGESRSGLPEPPPTPYVMTSNLTPGPGTPPFESIIQPGIVYTLTPSVTNPSDVQTQPFTMQVGNRTPAWIRNEGITGATGGHSTAAAYQNSGCGGGASQCWNWTYGNGMPPNQTSTKTSGARFSVSATTPEGQRVCFNLTVNPNDNEGNSATRPDSCFRVYRPHYPNVVGRSGDVHAGGGLCGGSLRQSTIFTNANSASLGEYVVSASSGISGFGSDNAAGNNSATLGQAGNYLTVCRPDLLQTATAYRAANSVPILPAGTVNLSGMSGIYFFAAGNLNISGTYSNKITIVSLGGTVNITGPITQGSTFRLGHDVPSLGIIAAGNIAIAGPAQRVDAYLFANGLIDTCSNGPVAACGNVLTVNGFLMSRQISFRRLGPPTGPDAVPGEIVNLTGQLYLNPPQFFDSAAVVNLLQNQGERPPLN